MGRDWADVLADDPDFDLVGHVDAAWVKGKADDPPPDGRGDEGGHTTRFRLVPFHRLTLRNVLRYLVKHLIPSTGLVLVWGPPKCGKSFWVFDLTMHIALERQYREHRVHGGTVIYCAFEGAEGFKARAEAFRKHHRLLEGRAIPFFLMDAVVDLVADHAALVGSIGATLGKERPAVVVLDTLNRSLRGSESSDEDMAAYVRAADAIKEAFGCAVVLVHHCGHDANRPRGHSSLLGAVDVQIAVTRDISNNVVATVERMKDGPEGAVVASRLETVELGIDEDGDPITSCVIVEVTDYAARPTTSRKLSDRQKLALDALNDLAADGEPAPGLLNLPGQVLTTTTDRWRDALTSRGVVDTKSANPRQDFKRLKDALMARRLIGEHDGRVWPV